MNLYQMIFKRRSIRKYNKEEIPEKLLQDITSFSERITPLCPEILTKLEIKNNLNGAISFKGLKKGEAPYYLVFYSEDKIGYEMNAGYILEQLLLYMIGKGLGSCYQGTAKLAAPAPDQMKQVLLVSFGYPKGLLYRDPSTAKRMALKELCVFKEEVGEPMKNILKAVRLAPSALNTQPWRFIVYHDRIYVFACREFFPSASLQTMRDVSIGIMLAHLSVAAEEMWMNLKFEEEEQIRKKPYKSGAYVITALILD